MIRKEESARWLPMSYDISIVPRPRPSAARMCPRRCLCRVLVVSFGKILGAGDQRLSRGGDEVCHHRLGAVGSKILERKFRSCLFGILASY